ncbi:MAG TPA: DUF3891 family protein [Acidisarcina sp.]|nr:DUF3891 family protein [Acidisarcina sp.]
MILRVLEEMADWDSKEDTAWHLVRQSQSRKTLPMLLIPQPAHAVLAGDLAAALLPDAFGELPANVLHAIRMHDTGWGILDAAQIHRVRNPQGKPGGKVQKASAVEVVSFLDVPPSEAVGAWKSSIEEMEKVAPESAYIVSQHFSLLSAHEEDRAHVAFRKQESARRERILKTAKCGVADLERWTDALGFCDLLSLYLCCGTTAAATLPRSHPSRPTDAPTVRVRQQGQTILMSEPIIRSGTTVEVHGIRHPAPAAGSAAQGVNWIFA